MIAALDKIYIKISFRKTIERVFCFFMEGIPVTRRGQWINPIVFLLYRLIIANYKKNKVFKNNPVYIIGTGRSGTTIFSKILSLHSNIAMLNEPKAIWSLANKNEDVIGSYNIAEKGRLIFDSNENVKKEVWVISAIYDWILSKTKRKIIVDKYPESIFRINWIKKMFIRSKFILIVRDGFETLNSINFWSSRHREFIKESKHDWWGVNNRKWDIIKNEIIMKNDRYELFFKNIDEIEKDQTLMAAVEWITAMEHGLEMYKKNKKDILIVHFDDIKQYNKNFINKVLDFLNLGNDKNIHSYSKKVLNYKDKKYEKKLPKYIYDYITKINLKIEKFKFR